MSVVKKCDHCNNSIIHETRSIYCNSCFGVRKRDICELITINDTTIFNQVNIDQLQYLINQYDITIRLDLHGVLDTIDHTCFIVIILIKSVVFLLLEAQLRPEPPLGKISNNG